MRQRRSLSKFWQAHIEAQVSSGLSISRYCKEHGLKTHQFHYYKKQVGLDQQSTLSGVALSPSKSLHLKPSPSSWQAVTESALIAPLIVVGWPSS